MKLQKRDCPIKVTIKPLGSDLLDVEFDFGYDKLEYTPSTGGCFFDNQFGEFVCALYTLYHEKNCERYDGHSEWQERNYHTNNDNKIQATTVKIDWDGEGTFLSLELTREWDGNTILLRSSMDSWKTHREFVASDRDFCYAVAKACTEVIKQFGFYGYRYSTESEPIKIHQLLFLKAYALDNMEARELTVVDEELDCCKSNFEKEMELLLFDM